MSLANKLKNLEKVAPISKEDLEDYNTDLKFLKSYFDKNHLSFEEEDMRTRIFWDDSTISRLTNDSYSVLRVAELEYVKTLYNKIFNPEINEKTSRSYNKVIERVDYILNVIRTVFDIDDNAHPWFFSNAGEAEVGSFEINKDNEIEFVLYNHTKQLKAFYFNRVIKISSYFPKEWLFEDFEDKFVPFIN